MQKFFPISCGETLPPNNVHAVSVSIPTMKDVLDYEEGTNSCIKTGYPRFVLHPYLKKLALFLQQKYSIEEAQEIVLVSSKRFAKLICERYGLKLLDCDEDFGVILVEKKSNGLQNVLSFIQHVGCNLSSRLAEKYLFENELISSLHVEELEDEKSAKEKVLSTLGDAYNQPKENICLTTSGMNAIYSVVKGIQALHVNKDTIIQLGWLYLDTMNIVENHFLNSKVFYDVNRLDLLEEYLKSEAKRVSAIITEVPTNPLLHCVDLDELKKLCNKYEIVLIIDATFAVPYNLDLKPYADVLVESLTKFACGNADVLMGSFIINENSYLSQHKKLFFSQADEPYIQDIQRLAYEIQGYEKRVEKINKNTQELVEYLKTKEYIKTIYYASSSQNYKKLMRHENAVGGVISLVFTKEFAKVYDTLNFAKGPSLGTEFTLLMPYVYLAHYDLITCKKGINVLHENGIPIDLLRVSVGIENIEEIKEEFDKLHCI
ncbi:aminotransferase class I/II-fold pyridoxal phosphate-dependent enzyme [Sulfurospirillum arcachonense]|uniref:aminotransferase class I/II-fold pyridoxal phosphate-dependent enzyme n=1 Tax=Sulfurospirillum arcachonense TaxID=57666 RepID=UPI00046ABB28|nr:aminotransferase class I/II-fold pyridoxal phosphate-dependent enzyme [Sulfurospirillum arcachonense]